LQVVGRRTGREAGILGDQPRRHAEPHFSRIERIAEVQNPPRTVGGVAFVAGNVFVAGFPVPNALIQVGQAHGIGQIGIRAAAEVDLRIHTPEGGGNAVQNPGKPSAHPHA